MSETVTTFKMKNGKIKSSVKPRYVETGRNADYKSAFAKKEINSMLKQMEFEIEASEAGSSTLIFEDQKGKMGGVINRSFTPSTFPKFLRETKINTKKDFAKVLAGKRGIRKKRLEKEAIKRLNEGFSNDHGYDMPDMNFRKKTGQVFDNKDIIFRRIRGRIVPIRVKKKNRFDLMEEAPF